ncbi:MAG: class I SAM-dependent methyltransferase, partial [Thermoplasmata archaeon]|nr:class I SAM-dependent methyltransferase [Thermoplasmata archaeon]
RRTPPISFDRVADRYDATRGLPSPLAEQVQEALANHLGSSLSLEVGVGTGRHLLRLLARGEARLVGVDVSPAMLRQARARGASRLVRSDARLLPFRDRGFDQSLSTHLLHLVEEWPRVLAEIGRVTSQAYSTVLELEEAEPDLSEEYRRQARDEGVGREAPGLSERKLPERLSADQVVRVGELAYEREGAQVIDDLASRAFRDQWEVPAPAHDRIIAELRRQHAGAKVRTHLDVRIASWRADSIRQLAEQELARASRASAVEAKAVPST